MIKGRRCESNLLYSLPVTASIVAMDRWRNILTRLTTLDFNVLRKLQGPISSVKGLKNRRLYSTPLPRQIFSSSWYVILQLVPKPSRIIVCYSLRVQRPSTMQFLNKRLHLKILLFRCCRGEPRVTMQIHTLNYAADVGLSNL